MLQPLFKRLSWEHGQCGAVGNAANVMHPHLLLKNTKIVPLPQLMFPDHKDLLENSTLATARYITWLCFFYILNLIENKK